MDIALRGLERLENSLVAPLQNTEQATRLAAIAAKTELAAGDAHVAGACSHQIGLQARGPYSR